MASKKAPKKKGGKKSKGNPMSKAVGAAYAAKKVGY